MRNSIYTPFFSLYTSYHTHPCFHPISLMGCRENIGWGVNRIAPLKFMVRKITVSGTTWQIRLRLKYRMNLSSFRVYSVKNYESYFISGLSLSNLSYHKKNAKLCSDEPKIPSKRKTNLNMDLLHKERGEGFWIF